MKINKPTSLYIHIPFCTHICGYCDFTKINYFRDFAIKYLKQLKNELSIRVDNFSFFTIYVGGGTPTSLEDDLFKELLEIIKPYTQKVIEYTFEANPESLSKEKLILMKKYGVNRLSIGVESTCQKTLNYINRHHTFSDVKKCIEQAKDIGIDNINVDLILGLPGIDKDDLKLDIKNLLSLDVNHISTYSLTVHENTVFYLNGIKEEEADESREKYDLVHTLLTQNNYIHYEISNFARASYESKHNFVYWNNKQYYGVGLGASGYIGNIRYENTKSLTKYLKGQYEGTKEEVSMDDELTYQIMLNLRTNKGVDLNYLKNRFDVDLLNNENVINYINDKYLYLENNHLIPTYEGMMILDNIILNIV